MNIISIIIGIIFLSISISLLKSKNNMILGLFLLIISLFVIFASYHQVLKRKEMLMSIRKKLYLENISKINILEYDNSYPKYTKKRIVSSVKNKNIIKKIIKSFFYLKATNTRPIGKKLFLDFYLKNNTIIRYNLYLNRDYTYIISSNNAKFLSKTIFDSLAIIKELNLRTNKIINLEKWKQEEKRIKQLSNIKEAFFYSYNDGLPKSTSLILKTYDLHVRNKEILNIIRKNLKKIKLDMNISKCKNRYLMKLRTQKDNWFILCKNNLENNKFFLSPINVKNNGNLFKIQNKGKLFYFVSNNLYDILNKLNLKKWR